MLGFLLVVVQVLLFLCVAGLLLLMRKNIWQTYAAGGDYMSSYQEGEPDYRNYEYEDDTEGGYNDYNEQGSYKAKNTAHHLKSQQYEYDEESEHYTAEMTQERHFFGQSEAYDSQDASVANPQRVTPDDMVPPSSADMTYRQNSDQTATHYQTEMPQPPLQAGFAPSHVQPESEQVRYYSEDMRGGAVRPQHHNEESLPKPKPQPDAKGVLFDDNDDDMAPFKVKF